jgi:hypothetical protein
MQVGLSEEEFVSALDVRQTKEGKNSKNIIA